MKILFHSNLFPDHEQQYRGQDNANLLHCLRERAEIRVISPRPVLPFVPLKKIVRREIDSPFSPVFPQYRYIPKVGSAFNHHLLRASVKPSFTNILQEFQPDVVLASWAYPDTCAVVPLAAVNGLPVVAITQGSDVHIHLRMPLRRRLIPKAFSHCAFVIARSNRLASLLEDAGVNRGKLRTIYNGVSSKTFYPGESVSARASLGLGGQVSTLLYVGNFYPVKNPLLLLRALNIVHRMAPDRAIQLVMIGEGPMQGKVEAAIRELGLRDLVRLVGRKTSDEVAQHMRAADLLCIPSDNEGLPNVLLEAFSCGLRVVSTDVGGIHEVLRHEFLGQLVPARDEAAMAEAIQRCLMVSPDKDRIVESSLPFTWKRTVETYWDVLESALA